MEFCGFLMRYHRAIDYSDFCESPFAVQRLRRFEEFKGWAEIDDLQALTEQFIQGFELFKKTNHKAFQEVLAYLDAITKEMTHKDDFKALQASLKNSIDAQLTI